MAASFNILKKEANARSWSNRSFIRRRLLRRFKQRRRRRHSASARQCHLRTHSRWWHLRRCGHVGRATLCLRSPFRLLRHHRCGGISRRPYRRAWRRSDTVQYEFKALSIVGPYGFGIEPGPWNGCDDKMEQGSWTLHPRQPGSPRGRDKPRSNRAYQSPRGFHIQGDGPAGGICQDAHGHRCGIELATLRGCFAGDLFLLPVRWALTRRQRGGSSRPCDDASACPRPGARLPAAFFTPGSRDSTP